MTDVVWSFHNRNWTGRMTRSIADVLRGSTLIQGDPRVAGLNIDRLIINQAGANFASSEQREAITHAIVTAREVVWIRNDYTSHVPKVWSQAQTPFRACARMRRDAGRTPISVWSSVEDAHQTLVNWNVFASAPPLKASHGRTHGMVYYTKYRPGRVPYYLRYLSEPSCEVHLSYPHRGRSLFFERFTHQNVRHLEPMGDVLRDIRGYSCSLYLEDVRSHALYCSPASRFYEVMSVIGAMLFQPEARLTLQRGGYTLRDAWIAWDGSQLSVDTDEIRRQQGRMVAQLYEERESVSEQIQRLWEAL